MWVECILMVGLKSLQDIVVVEGVVVLRDGDVLVAETLLEDTHTGAR